MTQSRDPAKPKTTSEYVADHLRSEIQRGEIPPGSRLRQNEIAERFGVSTTPVREAFGRLQREGLLGVEPHRGAVVYRPTAEAFRELYEIRTELEVLAVGKAAANITPDLASDLQATLNKMRIVSDVDRYLELNNTFHARLYEASNRPRLCAMIVNLRDASSAYLYLYARRWPPSVDIHTQHQGMLDACLQGNVAEAQRVLRKHLQDTVENVLELLGQFEEDNQEVKK